MWKIKSNEPYEIILVPLSMKTTPESSTTINANNFELKPALINMVQQNQYGGLAHEDPNIHLATFLEICDTVKMNGITEDAIQMRLFPFSLRDKAQGWL